MDMKNKLYLILTLSLCLLMAFNACTDEETPVAPLLPENGLCISLNLNGKSLVASRATEEGNDALNENAIEYVDFFIFKNDNDSTLYKHYPKQTLTAIVNDTTAYYTLESGKDWADTITAGWRLYAVVNHKGTISGINQLADLKGLTVTDTSIPKRQSLSGSTTDTDTTQATKLFLMDGYVDFTANDITNGKASKVVQKTVEVKRAAAKVRVNIYRAPNWPTDATITTDSIMGAVRNYATTTKLLTSSADIADNGLKTDYQNLAPYSQGTPGQYPDSLYINSLVFYSFANDWSNDKQKETTLRIDVPYDKASTDEIERPHNYYKIVMMLNGKNKLERNKLYDIDVSIAYDGAEEKDDPVELTNTGYKIAEWNTDTISVQRNDPADYLILSDYHLDMRNETDAQITFYSSNVIDTIEVIGFSTNAGKLVKPSDDNYNDDASFAKTTPATFAYPGEVMPASEYETLLTGTSAQDVPGAFYVNKDNYRIDITQDRKGGNQVINTASYTITKRAPNADEKIFVTWPGNQSVSGVIDIYSEIPVNVTKRYITLRVTMQKRYSTGTITRYVVIEQYPLEYITFRPGLVSYMSDSVPNRNNNGTVHYIYDCPPVFWEYDDTDKKNVKWFNEINLKNGGYAYGDSIIKYLKGHVPDEANMKSKFYLAEETWTDAEGTHYGEIFQIQSSYLTQEDKDDNGGYSANKNDSLIGIVTNGSASNNSMYLVTITVTSPQYIISYPKTVGTGSEVKADSTEANNNLVSPKFMIASQLGNNSAMADWEVAYAQCHKYVEVGVDGTVYDDWRLPTKAELEIIKGYQLDDDVYDITMNKVLNSDGDTQPRYWTAQKGWYVETTGAGTAQRHGSKYYSGEDDNDPTKVRVRCRCVRDVKE